MAGNSDDENREKYSEKNSGGRRAATRMLIFAASFVVEKINTPPSLGASIIGIGGRHAARP